MPLKRREFLKLGSAAALLGSAAGLPATTRTAAPAPAGSAGGAGAAQGPADYALRIGTGLIELSPQHIVATTLYNGQFPGPLLRLREGRRTLIDIHNDTDTPELVHWHGQRVPSEVDGAAEEGTPFVPPHGMRRVELLPKPAGFRFYHTHVVAGADLNRGTYTAQSGPLYIEPAHEPGAYDREVFLVLKEFSPTFSRGGDMALAALAGQALPELRRMGEEADAQAESQVKGYEVGYELFAINGHMLGHGEPIRVRRGRARPVSRAQCQRYGDPQPRPARSRLPRHRARWQPGSHSCRGTAALDRHRRTHLRDRGNESPGRMGARGSR